jgi:hypothetical protein
MTTGVSNDKASVENNPPSHRKGQTVEVSVFLFLIVPSMIMSFFVVKQGRMSFVLVALSTILRDLALVSLILFFVWRNGEPLKVIGWRLKNIGKEAVLGMLLFIPIFLGPACSKADCTRPVSPFRPRRCLR